MYFNILKRDLKRKKTMNIILLLFIILATTFVSSSVNNMLAVTTALDSYFEKADMPDYFAATMDKGDDSVSEMLDNVEEIDSYGIEHIIYMNPDNLLYKNAKLENMNNSSVLLNFKDADINYFDKDNKVLEEVEEGTVWISGKCMRKNDIQTGDTITIKFDGVSQAFKVAGSIKDAVIGSDMTGMARFIINEKDFEKFSSVEEISSLYSGSFCYINTNDTKAVDKALSVQNINIIFMGDMKLIKNTYIMDMIIAGVLLIVSVCLIAVSFVMLSFTISFTLSEEYREIGVMKAIGISNVKIRGLYMIKYLALALIGVAIGFFTSIPFGNIMLNSVSQSIVMDTDNAYLINFICSFVVVAIILLFCFMCTGKAKKFTPVDAIRNGETGKRYKKKGLLKLSKTPLNPSPFLALNDVLSNPKRFGTMIITFTICLSLVLVLVNTVNTLKSDKIVPTLGVTPSDVYLVDEDKQMSFMCENGRELLENELDNIEDTLAENDMPAECVYEFIMKLTVKHCDNVCKSLAFQGIDTTTDQYVYFEGTAPQNTNEIAMTKLIAEKLNAKIGDTVTISQLEGDKEYIITALFQSMNNMGEGIRFHENTELSFAQSAGFLAFQINFTDNPDKKETQSRIEKIENIYDTDKVHTAGEYVEQVTGASSMVDAIRILVLAVMIIVITLVTILMERSFITKERGEIALLKAVGFKNGKIISWHTLRFVIVAVISATISLATILPFTSLTVGPIFCFMGANYGIQYNIVPLEVFFIYPLIVLVTTLVSAFITAQHIRTIKASESSGIE